MTYLPNKLGISMRKKERDWGEKRDRESESERPYATEGVLTTNNNKTQSFELSLNDVESTD